VEGHADRQHPEVLLLVDVVQIVCGPARLKIQLVFVVLVVVVFDILFSFRFISAIPPTHVVFGSALHESGVMKTKLVYDESAPRDGHVQDLRGHVSSSNPREKNEKNEKNTLRTANHKISQILR